MQMKNAAAFLDRLNRWNESRHVGVLWSSATETAHCRLHPQIFHLASALGFERRVPIPLRGFVRLRLIPTFPIIYAGVRAVTRQIKVDVVAGEVGRFGILRWVFVIQHVTVRRVGESSKRHRLGRDLFHFRQPIQIIHALHHAWLGAFNKFEYARVVIQNDMHAQFCFTEIGARRRKWILSRFWNLCWRGW